MRVLLVVLGLATVASVVWLLLHAQGVSRVSGGAPDSEVPASPAVSVPPVSETNAPDGVRGQPESAPASSAGAFRDRVRSFLAAAPELDAEEREARAAELEAAVLGREAAGDLLPAESAYLQLALMRATVLEEDLLTSRSAALLERYREASQAGWQAYRNDIDPRHAQYRAAEARLVEAAGAEGLSTEALRARLQELREEIYGAGSN